MSEIFMRSVRLLTYRMKWLALYFERQTLILVHFQDGQVKSP